MNLANDRAISAGGRYFRKIPQNRKKAPFRYDR
jgi:hypothetical protein